MKFDLRNLSIKAQAFVIFGILIVLSIINFMVLNDAVRRHQTASQKMDIAGKTRMLSQQIALIANRIDGGEEDLKNVLKKAIDEQESILGAFEYGGRVPGYTSTMEPLTGAAQANLLKVVKDWNTYKVNLEILLGTRQAPNQTTNPDENNQDWDIATSKEEALGFINKNSEMLLRDCKEMAKAILNELEEKSSRLHYALIFFLGVNLIILTIIVFTIIHYFFKPLKNISDTAKKISEGDHEVISQYAYTNEVGYISNTLNEMVKSLRSATAFVEKIGDGNLDEQFEGANEDELSKNSLVKALITMREQMKEVREEEQKRKWSTEGLALFSDVLRSTDVDLHELGRILIAKLVEYSGSNQGGLYLLNEEGEKKLELIALYAYDRHKYDEKVIRLGEGLIGQTFLEKKTTLLLEIPEDYIRIGSGLGYAEPKSIIIVPLMVNDEIFGIVELGSFKKFEPFEIQFVEKLGENIASTISSVKVNQRTKQLLEDSQQLTEQMQAQEEEMRQNMEELTATQEEMQRTELELYSQQTAINANVGIAEFGLDGRLTTANATYIQNLGYVKDELSGMYFSQITPNAELWDKVIDGQEAKGWYEKNKRTGEQVKMQSTFVLVKTESDSRVVELITEFDSENVTTEKK